MSTRLSDIAVLDPLGTDLLKPSCCALFEIAQHLQLAVLRL